MKSTNTLACQKKLKMLLLAVLVQNSSAHSPAIVHGSDAMKNRVAPTRIENRRCALLNRQAAEEGVKC